MPPAGRTVAACPGAMFPPGFLHCTVARARSGYRGRHRGVTMDLRQDAFVRHVGRFARTMLRVDEVDAVLSELTQELTEALAALGSAVLTVDGGRLRLATALPPQLSALHRPAVEPGPALQAHRTQESCLVGDLRNRQETWPQFFATARDVGVVSVVAVPLFRPDTPLGVVEVYDARSRDWASDGLATVRLLADLATCFLTFALNHSQHAEHVNQLETALQSRVVIEQAKGMLAQRHGTSPERAFLLLRRHARAHHTSVHTVAEAVVNLGLEL